jgi:RimJ/RimL family protein N-acetyltransferase
VVGVWQEDPVLDFLPTDYNYDGLALDFTERPMGEGLADFLNELPDGLTLRRMDKELLTRSINYESMLAGLVEPDRVLEQVVGVFLMKGNEILAEAVSGPVIRGEVEIGIETYPVHRQHGYAAIASAALIQACETKGWKTYWNCAKQNVPSMKLARKLGYRLEQEYRVLAWT